MRASATHSLLSSEHGPERIPLVRALPDEILEAIDHALHQPLFGLTLVQNKRRVDVDAEATGRRRVLVGRHGAAPVLSARAAGPPGTIARRPKNRTSTPGPCSRAHSRATMWLSLSASVSA